MWYRAVILVSKSNQMTEYLYVNRWQTGSLDCDLNRKWPLYWFLIVLTRMWLFWDNQTVVAAVSGIVSPYKEADAYWERSGCCIITSDICCARGSSWQELSSALQLALWCHSTVCLVRSVTVAPGTARRWWLFCWQKFCWAKMLNIVTCWDALLRFALFMF